MSPPPGLFLCLLFLLPSSWCWPSGAPESACSDLTPQHGPGAQQSQPPYTVTYTKKEGGRYQVGEWEACGKELRYSVWHEK